MRTGFSIGHLDFKNHLIQGPLAGYSCAPMRALSADFCLPAYAFTEMISAHDVINKHTPSSRYLYRSPKEGRLCYQLSGTSPFVLQEAAIYLQHLGADLIDLNCACPKPKIRKKGAGSALLEEPKKLLSLVSATRSVLSIPLTVKIRLQQAQLDIALAKGLQDAGVDALIVHGRRWQDDYTVSCDYLGIARIKSALQIPVIANGDIYDSSSLLLAKQMTDCDAFMISRAVCGKPWLFAQLLNQEVEVVFSMRIETFKAHLMGLASLENSYLALLQGRSLSKYYFRDMVDNKKISELMKIGSLEELFTEISSWG
jgi:nifR3 family TIM-barrel protein